MSRLIELTRDEAELLVDLLTLTDHHLAEDLENELRNQWGMVPLSRQLEAYGMTLAEMRQRIMDHLLEAK